MIIEERTIEEFLEAYAKGQRHFKGWDFAEDDSISGQNLSGVIFEGGFLFLNFREANLTDAQFIGCNMKTADFSGANLTNATIKNCLVECTIFKDAITNNLTFQENYYYGITLQQSDFSKLIEDY